MHILVVNDDGPPSNKSSPYVHSLVQTLQAAGHTVSVVLPHTQRSWIGKAHMVGQTVKPTYFRPGTLHEDDGTTHARPSSDNIEEWVLVDGTPASCVQIGLYHYFKDRGPVDLVVSGPNYGRNSTAVFSLSSGTIGGAMEAAVCKRRAIALSYAFFTRNHDPEIIGGASRISVKLIEYLYNNWGEGVDLYTVNVPLVEGVEERKILWTHLLQNYWGEGSCFEEVDGKDEDADEEEEKIREKEGQQGEGEEKRVVGHTHKHFKWAPRFTDVYRSVEEAGPGNDGWAVQEGYTSVTPLKANFMHASAATQGELKLHHKPDRAPLTNPFARPSSDPVLSISNLSLQDQPKSTQPHFYAYIDYEDSYVQPLILSAMEQLPQSSYTLLSSPSDLPTPESPYLHISSYETIPFDEITSKPTTSLTNAYVIRKALIRKHYLSETSHIWCVKNPESILKTNIQRAEHFEVDYAEFLDDAIVECWDLKESFARNEKVDEEGGKAADREWWILKPGMSDRGQGIRLFSSYEELLAIFEGWEEDAPDSDEEDAPSQKDEDENENEKDYIQTSHLRHFLAQPYIHPPLLLGSGSNTRAPTNTKFHIRTYVLASGALDIYVYKPMLALFASSPYTPPWDSSSSSSSGEIDLSAHLTNTCIQKSESKKNAVHLLSSLPLPPALHHAIQTQIFALTSEIFVAAAKEMSIHFQPLPNAFEAFGLDFLVDAHGECWLLEVNAFPDFGQSGLECRAVVEGFWKEVVGKVVGGFFGVEGVEGEGELVRVGGVDLGRR
ncbi:hypothetical protein DSL72_004912 [Monilinia vaccinii-corymbosi]|uniref:Survival protein SurE-like phosphatase/nucleotidase domain-containing protein n=1 Tax=Monilinia vaccinii-corymbosi TaxID=61207 RepID=A0A8A3P965_9HELO|nr:hypothetical protein DSL72_004912 [Monilinia vaccinii-corymbosi]